MAKEKKHKRFVKTYSNGALSGIQIIVDKETGVNYLFKNDGYAGGLCPLVDAEGKPVVTPISQLNDD